MMDGKYMDFNDAPARSRRVVVALSGGVDSAAAALILKRSGFEVIGVTMKNFCYGDMEMADRSCCSIESIEDARRVCTSLGISHQVLDVEELFAREVIENFFGEYQRARTPNPCVKCNLAVRFITLGDLAIKYGAGSMATGHYARIFRSQDERVFLARAVDRGKDQSYFLSGLSGSILEEVLFPLGGYSKDEVRDLAREAALPVAEKEESQEVCFIPDGDLRSYLSQSIDLEPGPIVNKNGDLIGEHEGLSSYTIGQRRNLGISAAHPQYVMKLDRERNTLVAGEEKDLYSRLLSCELLWVDRDAVRFSAGGRNDPGAALFAQIRSRHKAAAVRSIEVNGTSCRVEFTEPQKAICPGQTVAFYMGELVVGSGIIDQAQI